MLINGKQINIPFRRDIVIPRVDEDIVLTAVAVSCEKEFSALVKEPEPPKIYNKNGSLNRIATDDPDYIKKRQGYYSQKLNYQILCSLENVEWQSVDLKDPETWDNWKQECIDSGLSDTEVGRIINEVMDTLNPTEDLVHKMRERFLSTRTQEAEKVQSSQDGDQKTT